MFSGRRHTAASAANTAAVAPPTAALPLCRRHRGVPEPSADAFADGQPADAGAGGARLPADVEEQKGEVEEKEHEEQDVEDEEEQEEEEEEECGWCAVCMFRAVSVQLHDTAQRLHAADRRVDVAEGRADAADRRADVAETRLREVQDRLEERREAMVQLSQANTVLGNALEAATASAAGRDARAADVERKADDARDDAAVARREAATFAARVTALELELAAERRTVQQLQRGTDRGAAELDAAVAAHRSTQRQLKVETANHAALQAQFAEARRQHEAEAEELRSNVRDLTTIKNTMRERVKYLEASVQELTAEVAPRMGAPEPTVPWSPAQRRRPKKKTSFSLFGKPAPKRPTTFAGASPASPVPPRGGCRE